jgi:hypothetical protein
MSSSNSEAYDSSSNVVGLPSSQDSIAASASDAETTIVTDDKTMTQLENLALTPNSNPSSSPNSNTHMKLPSPGREGQVVDYFLHNTFI